MNSINDFLTPAHSDSTAAALAGAVAAADAAVTHAQLVAEQLAGLSVVSLRQQGFTDAFIADHLAMSQTRVANVARAVDVMLGEQHRQLRAEVEARWDDARLALTWYQNGRVEFSRDIVRLYDIDISQSQPLSVDRLDLPAAEFVNSATGERFIVYSMQRWNGLPLTSSNDDGTSRWTWSGHGYFTLEHCTPDGERMTVNGQDWLELPPAATQFSVPRPHVNTASSDEAYDQIIRAFRRKYGALPPYLETATRALTYRHPQ